MCSSRCHTQYIAIFLNGRKMVCIDIDDEMKGTKVLKSSVEKKNLLENA